MLVGKRDKSLVALGARSEFLFLAPEEAPAENAQSFAARLQTALKRR